ncbi:MAG TPA: hypothetical protein VGE02_08710 [Gemmatimonadales bacterium]
MSRTARHLPLAAILLAALSLSGACSDPGGPDLAPGRYRLASVNGRPVPYMAPTSSGYLVLVSHGDLLIRGDGSFALGITDVTGLGMLATGRWSGGGDAVRLAFDPWGPGVPGSRLEALADGDSIAVDTEFALGVPSPLRLVFRLAPLPRPTVSSGTYVLTSMAGSTDLAFEDTAGGHRRVHRVLFDSLTFIDGLFFRRHRSERTEWYRNPTDPEIGSEEWVTFGSYDGGDGVLVLRDYRTGMWVRAADSLALGEGTLVRRTPALHPETGEEYTWEDVYSRR